MGRERCGQGAFAVFLFFAKPHTCDKETSMKPTWAERGSSRHAFLLSDLH